MTDPVQSIRIGTMVRVGEDDPAKEIAKIVDHGFECFQLFFWRSLHGHDMAKLADSVNAALEGTGAIISSLGIFGNPLEEDDIDLETRAAWETLVENAYRFDCDLVTGFAGRLRNRPLTDSLPKFQEIFGSLADKADGKNVRLAFENCAMDGNWFSGDWNIAIDPIAWEMLFDKVPAKNIGLEWEPCHQMLALIDPLPQIEDWADRIFHVHGKDAAIAQIEHHHRGHPMLFDALQREGLQTVVDRQL